jgi:FkbM family methyltransferase
MESNGADAVVSALRAIGRNEKLKRNFLDLCRQAEVELPGDSRHAVTGPLVDALHEDGVVYRRRLRSGAEFEFLYSSRIAREFVMAQGEPDHVWEPQTTKLLLHLARGAGNVVVGGAYFGDHAVLIARRLQAEGGFCHAFEPNPESARMLSRNGELNRLTNLKVHRLGLWDEDDARLTLVGDDALASSAPAAAEDPSAFPTTTVDAYLDRAGVDRVGLLMIDVEGAELRVLRGARRRLALPPGQAPHLVFEVHRHYTDWSDGLHNTDVVRMLTAAGYHVFAVRDFHANYDMADRPIELIRPETTYLEGPPHGFNMVAVKDLDALRGDGFLVLDGVSPKLLVHKDPALHHPAGGL